MLRVLLIVCSIVAGLTLAALPTSAQQPPVHDALLDHMVGTWALEGTIGGQKATHDVDVQWVMKHQYLRVHEVSRDKMPDGTPNYEATDYIDRSRNTGQYRCVFLDTYGGIGPGALGVAAKPTGNNIPLVFNYGGQEFHVTLTYVPASDSWTWRLDSIEKGKPKPFARLTMTRISGSVAALGAK